MMMSMITTPNLQPQSISTLLHFTPNSNPNNNSKQPTLLLSNSTPTNQPSLRNNPNIEIRVCTNRTCRKQGSFQILHILLGISPPHVTVNSCGCLGHCSSGPNLVVLPPAAVVSHCGTAACAADLMVDVCGGGGDDFGLAKRSLDFLAFKKRAEKEFERQNFAEAEDLFSQAIDAKPVGGIHIAYKGRSAVRLALGNFSGALDDVNEALVYSPQYAEAYICQGDILLAMDQLEDAEESYVMALESDRSLRRSKAFKARLRMLQDKMTSAAIT